jgi:hypothetical protein
VHLFEVLRAIDLNASELLLGHVDLCLNVLATRCSCLRVHFGGFNLSA